MIGLQSVSPTILINPSLSSNHERSKNRPVRSGFYKSAECQQRMFGVDREPSMFCNTSIIFVIEEAFLTTVMKDKKRDDSFEGQN